MRLRGGPSQTMRRLGGAVRPYLETLGFVALCLFLALATVMMADIGWPT